jgi:hypothetical protein
MHSHRRTWAREVLLLVFVTKSITPLLEFVRGSDAKTAAHAVIIQEKTRKINPRILV